MGERETYASYTHYLRIFYKNASRSLESKNREFSRTQSRLPKRKSLGTIDAQVIDVIRMTASNIITGTLDADIVRVKNIDADEINTGTLTIQDGMTIENADGTVELDSESFTIYGENDKGKMIPRIQMGKSDTGKYLFVMYDKKKNPTLYMDDNGSAIFQGEVRGGKITSDTSIKVTTDVIVGRYLKIGCTNIDPSTGKIEYTEGNIQFGGGASIQGGNNGDNLELNAAGMIEIIGAKIRLSSSSAVECNGKQIATQNYVDQAIDNLRDWCNRTFEKKGSGGGTVVP